MKRIQSIEAGLADNGLTEQHQPPRPISPAPQRPSMIPEALLIRMQRERQLMHKQQQALEGNAIEKANKHFVAQIKNNGHQIIQSAIIHHRQYFLLQERNQHIITTYQGKDRISYCIHSQTPIVHIMASIQTDQLVAISKTGEFFLIDPLFKVPEIKLSNIEAAAFVNISQLPLEINLSDQLIEDTGEVQTFKL